MTDLFENLVNVALNDPEGLGQTLYPIIEAETAHRRVASATVGTFRKGADEPIPSFDDLEQKDRKYSPELFLDVDRGTKVFCHLNINKMKMYGVKAFSVKVPAHASGKVVGHVAGIVLSDGEFRVGEAGFKQIQRGGAKGVHAGAIGRITKSDPPGNVNRGGGVQVRYNPHQGMRWFMRENPETGEWDIPVWKASEITLVDWKVYARNPIDIPMEKRGSLPSLRNDVIRLAASMPKGDKARRKLLSMVKG